LKNRSLKIKNYTGVHTTMFQKEVSIQTRFEEFCAAGNYA